MAADLSKRHDLVGDLLDLPRSHDEWERYRLTDEQVAFYHEQGYLAGIRILTDEQCDKLCTELAMVRVPHQRVGSARYRALSRAWRLADSPRLS
jgi:hypothetical protein